MSTIEKFLVSLDRLGCGIQQLMGQEGCCCLVTSGCLVLQTNLEYSAVPVSKTQHHGISGCSKPQDMHRVNSTPEPGGNVLLLVPLQQRGACVKYFCLCHVA